MGNNPSLRSSWSHLQCLWFLTRDQLLTNRRERPWWLQQRWVEVSRRQKPFTTCVFFENKQKKQREIMRDPNDTPNFTIWKKKTHFLEFRIMFPIFRVYKTSSSALNCSWKISLDFFLCITHHFTYDLPTPSKSAKLCISKPTSTHSPVTLKWSINQVFMVIFTSSWCFLDTVDGRNPISNHMGCINPCK